MTDKIEIRELQVKDMYAVAKMLTKAVKSGRDEIKEMIKNTGEEGKELTPAEEKELGIDLAFFVLQNCLEFAEEDLNSWLAELCEVEPDEFMEMPLDTPVLIFEQIAEQNEVHSFFIGVLRLFKKMNKSRNRLTGK